MAAVYCTARPHANLCAFTARIPFALFMCLCSQPLAALELDSHPTPTVSSPSHLHQEVRPPCPWGAGLGMNLH